MNLYKDLEQDAHYITDYANGKGGKDPQRLIDCTITMLRAAFELKRDEWIAVGDKLPDLHEEVWDASGEIVHYKISEPCLCVFNGEEMIVAAYEIDSDIDFGGWVSCFDSDVLHSVTHWRPLPKLPNE